ncbi:MAG: DUF1223 domain-containing protein [Proteobacteria bacterium]|nr:DUF1223 domain-containing protein [Pseudomonadota bacterium]
MRSVVIAFLGAALVATAGIAVAGEKLPIVIELFTSQGCNSCPPADEFLAELTKRDDIIALAFHVNYWDYLGWKDTFASDATTARQRTYATFLGERTVYTPQMVIGGVAHKVGSRRSDVMGVVDRLRQRTGPYLDVRVRRVEGGKIAVTIPAGELKQRDVVVWLVRYDSAREVNIKRGENRGRTLKHSAVARTLTVVGTLGLQDDTWAATASIPLAPTWKVSNLRVIGFVQERRSRHIIGAGSASVDSR